MKPSPWGATCAPLILLLICLEHFELTKAAGAKRVQSIRDEFNTTETAISLQRASMGGPKRSTERGRLIRQTLMRFKLDQCCPTWTNVSQTVGDSLHEQQQGGSSGGSSSTSTGGSFYNLGRPSRKVIPAAQRKALARQQQATPSDLLDELGGVFANVTQLSIDGQPGNNEAEKYYKFYDDVQYYLRLLKLAQNYLDESAEEKGRLQRPAAVDNSSNGAEELLSNLSSDFELLDQRLAFKRNLESIKLKASLDPVMSSFVGELSSAKGEHFELYGNFIKSTDFGLQYAKNISMVRDSVRAFDQICQHLSKLTFPSNMTKPSKQYAMIRRMALKLFQLRHELTHQVNARVLANRQDARRLFRELDELIDARPEIRMLGDEFGDHEEEKFYSKNVKKLTGLLDKYTTNNMTQLTFYNELAELPEEFILFGTMIAREYEIRELPRYNRFDFNYYKQDFSIVHSNQQQLNVSDNSTSNTADARQSSHSYILSSLLGR